MQPTDILAAILKFDEFLPTPAREFFYIVLLLILFIILALITKSTWLYYRQQLFQNDIRWVLAEIKIPRTIMKTPRAMEQVLASIHALRNFAGDLREIYWDGEVTRWYSLETVSFGGETHFYIRFYWKQRGLVEAAFFSYYPDIELIEVEDYISQLPNSIEDMYQQGYELWGTEMTLAKSPGYPIKTYPEFLDSSEEEKQFDPMSSFLEVLSKVKKEEIVGIQILAAPKGNEWREDFEDFVESLRETKISVKKMEQATPDGQQFKDFTRSLMRSPGETDVLKAVENNLSKPAFDTLIRFIYFSPKSLFYDSFARRGLTGAFNQYSALDLNSFKQNYSMGTRVRFWNWPHIFPGLRNEYRKQRLLFNYRHREMPPETWMGKLISSKFFHPNFACHTYPLNTEALATLFHPPMGIVLTAPHIQRIESRRAGPPAGLAIYGEESSIDRFTKNNDKDKPPEKK